MNHILVTGGAGFIGSHLCDALLAKGNAVTALDNLVTGRTQNIKEALKHPQFDFVECNVSEPLPLVKLKHLKEHGLHGIFHFACPASPVDFELIPFDIMAVDSLGTMHTVDLAFKHDCRFLLASTSEIYGDPLEHPQKETYFGNVNSIGPRACYDETKRFGEAYVSSAIRGSGTYKGKPFKALNGAMVRIFNTYGPRMRPDDGRIVPELCMRALRGDELTIHGDGKQTRSYCYITDLVEGVLRLFESDVREPVNIGNPDERTVLEFTEVVVKLTGSKSELKHFPSRPDDPKRRSANIEKAKRLLDWSPQVKLDEGLTKTLEYFKQYV